MAPIEKDTQIAVALATLEAFKADLDELDDSGDEEKVEQQNELLSSGESVTLSAWEWTVFYDYEDGWTIDRQAGEDEPDEINTLVDLPPDTTPEAVVAEMVRWTFWEGDPEPGETGP